MTAATNPAVAAIEAELTDVEARIAAAKERAAALVSEAKERAAALVSEAATSDLVARRGQLRKALALLCSLPSGSSRGEYPCPECGYVAKARTGLGAHRRYRHGITGVTSKPKVLAPDAPVVPSVAIQQPPTKPVAERPIVAPEPPKPIDPKAQRVLACRENGCDAEFDVGRPSDLMRHAMQAHERRATQAERTPVRRGVAA